MTHKMTLEKRRAAGLCRCGNIPASGKKTCQDCITVVVAKTRQRMADRRRSGLCRCGRPMEGVAKKCRGCRSEHVARVARVQKRHRAAGRCACGCPPVPGKSSCDRCLKRRKMLTEKHKAKGICIGCQCRPADSRYVLCSVCREKNRTKGLAIRARYRRAVMDHYGGRCACCGETANEFLTIDHKDNDGAAHRKIVDGSTLYRWLMKNNYPGNFQILCMNCNWAKGRYGECPHNRFRLSSMVT